MSFFTTIRFLPFLVLTLMLPTSARVGSIWPKNKHHTSWLRVLLPGGNYNTTALHFKDLQACDVKEHGAFEDNSTWKAIWLYNNPEPVDFSVFKSVPNLTCLDLHDNKLRETPAFDQHSPLSVLRLDVNRITAIRNTRTFSGCSQLLWLELSNNLIEYIHPDVFKPLIKLKELYLYRNRLRFISGTTFQLKSLEMISLHHNLIEYVSPDAFSSRLGSLFLQDNLVSYLSSKFAELTGVTEFFFYHNPWPCGCLLEVLADLKKAGVSYGASWYDGKKKECVFVGRYPCNRPTTYSGQLLPPPKQ